MGYDLNVKERFHVSNAAHRARWLSGQPIGIPLGHRKGAAV